MRNILVTGATRGLGLAITKRLKTEGYCVIAVGRKTTPELNALVENSQEQQGRVVFTPFDLFDTYRIHGFLKEITKSFGALYGLINNAALGLDGILATMHDTEIEKMIRLNTLSPILMAKYASRSMLLEGEGRIINIASIIGFTGFNGLSVYGATKSAMLGFSKSLSRELGKGGVTVNSIAPGYMQTEMTKSLSGEKLKSIERRSSLGTLVTVDDVAGSVVFLLSKDARFITGTTLTVDAGSTA